MTIDEEAIAQHMRWREMKVTNLISAGLLAVNDGYRVRNVELGVNGTPFVRGGDIGDNGEINTDVVDHVLPMFEDRLNGKFSAPGDVAFISKGTVGRVGRLREGQPRIVFAPQVCFWRSLNPGQISPAFLYYLLRSRIFQSQLDAVRTHGAMVADYVSLGDQRAFTLPVPAIEDQRAISALLDSLDDKIEQNRRTGRTLEGLARATFKAWFVDFEPVKAKAAGATSFPGMPFATFATLPDCLTDSPIGPVPQEWEVRPIGELVTVKGGGTPSTKVAEYWDDGTHFWATPKDLSGLQDPVLLGTERRITDAGAECISSGVMPENTVLLSSRAPVGYTAIAKVPVAVNQGFIAMACDGPLPAHYVLHWTRSALDEIKSRASGTTFPEISKSAFRPIPALVPTPVIVQEFERFAQGLFDLIEVGARQSRKLGELRDYLLPRLLNGSIRVRA